MKTTHQSRARAYWTTAWWAWTIAVALSMGASVALADDSGPQVLRPAARPEVDQVNLSTQVRDADDPATVRPRMSLAARMADRPGFLPRINGRLQSFHGITRSDGPSHLVAEDVFHDQTTETVRRGVTRASRKAAKDFLLETMRLEEKIDSMKDRRHDRRAVRAEASGASPSQEPSKFDFDVRFHSAMPELVMRYDLVRGDMKFVVSAEGDVKLRYRSETLGRAEVQADFDGDDRYRLLCRFGF